MGMISSMYISHFICSEMKHIEGRLNYTRVFFFFDRIQEFVLIIFKGGKCLNPQESNQSNLF